jgi:hypothetical protein
VGRHLAGVHGLEPHAGRDRDHRQLGQLPCHDQGQVVELGRPQRRPADAGVLDDPLAGPLLGEVAERGPVQAAHHRDPVGPDHGDGDQVAHPGAGRGPDQRAGLVTVALGAAGAVHDRADPVQGGRDPGAGGKITGDVLDPLARRVRAAAEHPDLGAGRPQLGHDQAAEGPGSAGHEHGCGHDDRSPRHIVGFSWVT